MHLYLKHETATVFYIIQAACGMLGGIDRLSQTRVGQMRQLVHSSQILDGNAPLAHLAHFFGRIPSSCHDEDLLPGYLPGSPCEFLTGYIMSRATAALECHKLFLLQRSHHTEKVLSLCLRG